MHSAVTTMQTQRLRRWAVHVLLAWLLTLGAGIVNACVVQLELHNRATIAAHGHGAALKALSHASAEGGAHHQHSEGDSDHASNVPCERFCDEPSAVPQQAKQKSDSAAALWPAFPPPAPFVLPIPETDVMPGSRPVAWRATVPIPIAFLRLTL